MLQDGNDTVVALLAVWPALSFDGPVQVTDLKARALLPQLQSSQFCTNVSMRQPLNLFSLRATRCGNLSFHVPQGIVCTCMNVVYSLILNECMNVGYVSLILKPIGTRILIRALSNMN